MIKIEERIPKKCPGLTSLFITFDYSPTIVSLVKQIDGAVYDRKTTSWEIPVVGLQKFLDSVII